jgi:glycosyltransferase involved in cell wall biosynthesis
MNAPARPDAPPKAGAAPRVSVVIPAYNAAATLPETLASVIAQTMTDYEVIVVDDGSTDATPAVLARYGDRIRVLRKVNEGRPSTTRNLGAQAARGELVAFLDADDRWRPEKLARQLALFAANPRLGLVYTAAAVIDSNGRVLRVNPCPRGGRGRIYSLLAVGNMMVGSSVMVRRIAIAEAGWFDEELTSIENWDLWIRIARRWEVDFVDEPLTSYRVHPGNRSADVELRRRNIFRILAKTHDAADRSPAARRLRRDAYFNAYYVVLGMGYFDRLEMGAAARALAHAFLLKPRADVARLLATTLLGRRLYLTLRGTKERFTGAGGDADAGPGHESASPGRDPARGG